MVATHDLNYAGKLDKVFRIENGDLKSTFKMNNLLLSGGWFIWPLLVCSILLISIVLERLVVFTK